MKDIRSNNEEFKSPRRANKPDPKPDSCCDHGHKHEEKEDHDGHGHSHGDSEESKIKMYLPTAISLLLLLAGLILDHTQSTFFEGYIRMVWYALAYVLVGGKVLMQAFKSIKKGEVFNEFFLMGIATLGAFYIGEYAEGVAVMLFYVIGEHFQEAAVLRSRKSIKELIDNRPQRVTLVKEGIYREVDPASVQIGEVIQIKAGEKVALDGELLTEQSSFNTAALTGESKPDTKAKGEKVLAGMINLDKVIEIKVTSAYEDSALSKILKMVERATGRKAKTQQFISNFAKIYTPIVVFLALGVTFIPYFFDHNYVFNVWLYRALIFLVISCPCALVISIPLGYFGGIGAASRRGILFKGSSYLDEITKVDTIIMDKTGTLTKGVFKVQQVKANNMDEEKLVTWTAALESKSTHPIAKAVTDYAKGRYEQIQVSDIEEVPGLG
ncbi:MAG TPA: HAD-IC family P-type ATPase, partial [Cytophagales bacterium]|nr:HAD-IC family P-type ATPase [Cytophagales bacterium]